MYDYGSVGAPNLSSSMVEVFAMTRTLHGVLYNRDETEMDGFGPPHKLYVLQVEYLCCRSSCRPPN